MIEVAQSPISPPSLKSFSVFDIRRKQIDGRNERTNGEKKVFAKFPRAATLRKEGKRDSAAIDRNWENTFSLTIVSIWERLVVYVLGKGFILSFWEASVNGYYFRKEESSKTVLR